MPQLAAEIAGGAPPKGEIVLLVGPPGAGAQEESQELIDAKIGKALETLSVKDAAAVVSAETGQPRRKVYARAVELAAENAYRRE
jgi:16S rRNA (cytidine1402-2'-O)-methyltransferase